MLKSTSAKRESAAQWSHFCCFTLTLQSPLRRTLDSISSSSSSSRLRPRAALQHQSSSSTPRAPIKMPAPPPMPRWPPLPTGAPPPLVRGASNRNQQPHFPPLPRPRPSPGAAPMVHPVNGSSRLRGSGGQHTMAKQRAMPTYANLPRAGVFQYQNSTYHQRAVQRQLWDQQSTREAGRFELGGYGREKEQRHSKMAPSENPQSLRAPLPARRVYTQGTTTSTQRGDPCTPAKALEASIWSTTPLELAAMAQQLAQAKRTKRMVQSQVAKAKKTWYYADEHQQYPEESTASNDSTGDESSSDPEDDTPLSVRRFYALAFMLPPSPRSR